MQNRLSQIKDDVLKEGKSETISELAHRHLLNPNHTTTDEEIRNARIEFSDSFDISTAELSAMSEIDNDTVLPPLSFEKNMNIANSETNEENRKEESIPNPYNILE